MSFLSKLFGRRGDDESMVIPEAELELDEADADSLIAGSEIGATAIGLSDDGQRVFFVMKQALSPSEIKDLRKAIEQHRVKLECHLLQMPTYPVFVIKATIFDRPRNPSDSFWLETFPNLGGADKMILQRLAGERPLGICFHFYGADETLLVRTGYISMFPIPGLEQAIVRAETYLETLPTSVRNYRAAVEQVIRENP
jgi:hypothetical protein